MLMKYSALFLPRFLPPCISRHLGDLRPLFRRERLSPRLSPLLATQSAALNIGWVFPVIFTILNLPGRNIADQLRKLNWIARTFLSFATV